MDKNTHTPRESAIDILKQHITAPCTMLGDYNYEAVIDAMEEYASTFKEAVKEKEKPVNGQYKFYKSSREGMADVFHNGSSIGLWPYHIAFELCNAANSHYDLISKLNEKEKEIEELKAKNDRLKVRLSELYKIAESANSLFQKDVTHLGFNNKTVPNKDYEDLLSEFIIGWDNFNKI